MGFSWFAGETWPGFESAVAKLGNLVFHRKHNQGGHFAALERPKEMMEDIEEFVDIVRGSG
jgi:microsomal epoxide hydrolase